MKRKDNESQVSYFKVYEEDTIAMRMLSAEELGQLIIAMADYAFYGQETEFDSKLLKILWPGLKAKISRDLEVLIDKCTKNSLSANYGTYSRKCKRENKVPLSYDDWLDTIEEQQETSECSANAMRTLCERNANAVPTKLNVTEPNVTQLNVSQLNVSQPNGTEQGMQGEEQEKSGNFADITGSVSEQIAQLRKRYSAANKICNVDAMHAIREQIERLESLGVEQ